MTRTLQVMVMSHDNDDGDDAGSDGDGDGMVMVVDGDGDGGKNGLVDGDGEGGNNAMAMVIATVRMAMVMGLLVMLGCTDSGIDDAWCHIRLISAAPESAVC